MISTNGKTLLKIYAIVGEQSFARLLDIFAGVTVTFPSKSALEKMRKSREFLNGLAMKMAGFCTGPKRYNAERHGNNRTPNAQLFGS
jgi:hypothetical protein